MNPCLIPTPKPDLDGDKRWESMHKRYLAETKSSEVEVVWIGDSIIQQLQLSSLWRDKISSLHCANFGIGGDRVEHILWRIENGELDFSSTIKVVVLFVGTNNTDRSAQEVFAGIVNLVEVIKNKLNDAVVVLPTLLPRGQFPNKVREKNLRVNDLLKQKYENDNQKDVQLVPIHENIVQDDGTISHHVLYDYLHLTDSAYTKVFQAVYEKVVNVLNK